MLTRLNPFRRPPDAALTPAQTEANIRRLVWEIGWFGVAWGAVINYLQVYEVRLGASSLLVGAITYGPALVSIFWQLPAAGLITRQGPPDALGDRSRLFLSADVPAAGTDTFLHVAGPRPGHGRGLGAASHPGDGQQHRLPLDDGGRHPRKPHDPGRRVADGRLRAGEHSHDPARRRAPAAHPLPAELPDPLPHWFRSVHGQLVARQAHPCPRPRTRSQPRGVR